MTENRKTIPGNAGSKPMTDEQLEKVSGGEELSLSAVPIIYLKCAVDARHIWPYGLDACPVCGSTEFIRTVLPD